MKILVVDDSRSARMGISAIIEEMGHTVDQAASGEEALGKIAKEDFDLITLDVEMPDMNGYETCAKIRTYEECLEMNGAAVPASSIIFLTGNDDMKGRKKGFDSGATDFLSKDSLRTGLPAIIHRRMDSKSRLAGLRAIVVDDSRASRNALKSALTEYGVEVDEADDGSVALEILRNDPNYDIILTDLHMKTVDGDELCRKVRNELGMKQIPILVVTSDANKETCLELFKAGASDYLSKPILKEELVSRALIHLE